MSGDKWYCHSGETGQTIRQQKSIKQNKTFDDTGSLTSTREHCTCNRLFVRWFIIPDKWFETRKNSSQYPLYNHLTECIAKLIETRIVWIFTETYRIYWMKRKFVTEQSLLMQVQCLVIMSSRLQSTNQSIALTLSVKAMKKSMIIDYKMYKWIHFVLE